jgi:hypothetical protein
MKGRRQTRAEPPDDAVRTMLLARAHRADTRGLLGEVRRTAAGMPQRTGLALLLTRSPGFLPRPSLAAATMAVVVLVVAGALLFQTGHPTGPAASGPPSPNASPPSSSLPGP